MEAKLAMMEKRKPADEDYVPGMGLYRDGGSASPLPITPGEPGQDGSPTPDDLDMDYEEVAGSSPIKAEEEISREEAALAAASLEREFISLEREYMETSGHLSAASTPVIKEERSDSPPRLRPLPPGLSLPPKPVTVVPPLTSRSNESTHRRTSRSASDAVPGEGNKARQEALKRGLAGLPKKPVF